jgi:signal transduction histidine kinase
MRATSPAGLLDLLARPGGSADLLPRLHEHLVGVAGGISSILFEAGPGTRRLHATSGFGVDALPLEPWRPAPAAETAIRRAHEQGAPVVVADLRVDAPSTAALLGAASALVVPLVHRDGAGGVVLVGLHEPSLAPTALEAARAAGDAFVVALDRARLERDLDLQRELQELLDRFARAASSTLNLEAALEGVCQGAARLFAATRASVWLHDRDARELVLTAATDRDADRPGTRVPTGDALSAAATVLRRAGPELLTAGGRAAGVGIPLRWRRRALGVLLVEALHVDAGRGVEVLERAGELGRQLSAALENVLLLENVLQTRRELAQAEKLASIGRFVAGVAHEINNPLQGIIGHLDLIATTDLRPALRRDIRQAAREAERAARIVRSLLVFGASRRVERRPVAVPGLVSRAVALRRRPLLAAGITVTRDVPPGLPRVNGDLPLLLQALLNLLLNAEQAMAGPGDIRITARAEQGTVRLAVRDTGPGIPPEVLPRLFEPFFTTKPVGAGTGLGLPIVYGIVQEHGGRVWAENAQEGGAIFTLTLPAAEIRK